MSKADLNVQARTIKEIHVEDVQLVVLDDACFELLIYCSREHRRKGEIPYHKRLYRCAITDKYLDKLKEEIDQKYGSVT